MVRVVVCLSSMVGGLQLLVRSCQFRLDGLLPLLDIDSVGGQLPLTPWQAVPSSLEFIGNQAIESQAPQGVRLSMDDVLSRE